MPVTCLKKSGRQVGGYFATAPEALPPRLPGQGTPLFPDTALAARVQEGGSLPGNHRAVETQHDQPTATRAEGGAGNGLAAGRQGNDLLAVARVPELHSAVAAAADESFAAGRKGERGHSQGVGVTDVKQPR